MKRCPGTIATCVLLLVIPRSLAAGDAPGSTFPEGAKLRLDLAVTDDGTGTLEIRNAAKRDLNLYTLSNRLALTFLVMDEHGNIVEPQAKAKVDPPGATIFELQQGQSFTHRFKNLDYVSGTALFGYALQEGKTYRTLAVYCPDGLRGPGFGSNECVFKYRAKETAAGNASADHPALSVAIAVPARGGEQRQLAALRRRQTMPTVATPSCQFWNRRL